MKLGAVLLAAGLGTRFGGDKLRFVVDGAPLYRRAMDAVPAARFTRAVVVARDAELLRDAAARGYCTILNDAPERGISSSIALGLAALDGMDAALFSVCDQPWLTAESVARLVAAYRASPDRIAALAWGGRRGNPVIFPEKYFAELLALEGDTGGGAVVARHLDRLLLVPAAREEELCDVDST